MAGIETSQADDRPNAVEAWNQCYRDRTLATAITQAQDRLQAKAFAESVTLLQWVLDQPQDGFVETKSGVQREVVSARSRAEQLLGTIPSDLYGRQVGADAERIVQVARDGNDEGALSEVVQEYFLTQSGFAAAERLIAYWMDCGEQDLARGLLKRVLSEPGHQSQVSVRLRTLAEVLNVSTAAPNGDFKRSEPLPVRQKESRSRSARADRGPNLVGETFGADWPLAGGDHHRNRFIHGSMPLLRPAWNVPAQSLRGQLAFSAQLKVLEVRHRDLDRPLCAASFPIVVRDKVVFRNLGEIAALHVADGRRVWEFACESSDFGATDRVESGGFPRNGFRQAGQPVSPVEQWFEDARIGMLACDGRQVYALDAQSGAEVDEDEVGLPPDPAMAAAVRSGGNRLVALYLDQPGPANRRVAWTHDGLIPVRSGASRKRMLFLGPPLPGTTELLCVTEQSGEIHLTSLEPSSGSLRWTQPVCVLDRAALLDHERQFMSCTAARADGIVVFPTHTGLMVAFDLVRRRLLWASFVDDLPDVAQQRQQRVSRQPILGHAGFASHAVIAGDRVVYLPPRSRHVHCLDLSTGRSLWTTPRGDGEFVANIVEDRVLVVGRQSCRSLSLVDGTEQWSSPTGGTAGRGVCLENRYVLPLSDGRLAAIDLTTGRDVGSSIPTGEVPLGHLIADGRRVYSLSHRELTAFPQAHTVRAELVAGIGAELTPAERELALAEIDLAEGQIADAELKLRAAMSGTLSATQLLRTSHYLKRLLFAKFSGSDAPTAAESELLERLIETPTERFQFLAFRSRHLAHDATDPVFAGIVRSVYELPSGLLATSPEDSQWSMSPAVWNRLMQSRAARDETKMRKQPAWLTRALATPAPGEQRRFVRAFEGDPQVWPVRSRLATQLAENGESQSAETLWLRNRQSADPASAAEAAARLSELWERAGFIDEAAEQLEALATDFARVRLPDGATGAEYVHRLAPGRLAWQVWRNSQSPAWQVDRVEISTAPAVAGFVQQPGMEGIAANERGRFVPERAGSFSRQVPKSPEQPCDFVFTTNEAGADDQQRVTVFDRRTALPRGAVSIPASHRWPLGDKLASLGHLIPLGTPGGAIGLSTMQLTDGEPVWKQLPAELKDRQSATFPGPGGATFASFLWRNRLFVLDPLDGELLWQRTLALSSPEAASNQRLEIVGDQLALAVQSLDRSSYEVFETATGRHLKTVRPGFDPRQWQAAFGRHIAGIVDSPAGRRLQIRDLLKEDVEISEPVGDRVLTYPLGRGEFAFLGTRGEIKVFDVPNGLRKLDVSLDPAELTGFGAFRVLADPERYYVGLQRQMPSLTTAHYHQAMIDSPLPGLHLRDDLYAFDRATGRLLWRRSLPQRTVLQFPRCRVPFLVAISLVKDRQNTNLQSLTVEVLSGLTGETIGYRENLPHDRLLAADYDAVAGLIVLSGQSSNIELRFGPDIQHRLDW